MVKAKRNAKAEYLFGLGGRISLKCRTTHSQNVVSHIKRPN